MRDNSEYKTLHVKDEVHADLVWLKKRANKPMTEIVGDLARAAREGIEEKTLRR